MFLRPKEKKKKPKRKPNYSGLFSRFISLSLSSFSLPSPLWSISVSPCLEYWFSPLGRCYQIRTAWKTVDQRSIKWSTDNFRHVIWAREKWNRITRPTTKHTTNKLRAASKLSLWFPSSRFSFSSILSFHNSIFPSYGTKIFLSFSQNFPCNFPVLLLLLWPVTCSRRLLIAASMIFVSR